MSSLPQQVAEVAGAHPPQVPQQRMPSLFSAPPVGPLAQGAPLLGMSLPGSPGPVPEPPLGTLQPPPLLAALNYSTTGPCGADTGPLTTPCTRPGCRRRPHNRSQRGPGSGVRDALARDRLLHLGAAPLPSPESSRSVQQQKAEPKRKEKRLASSWDRATPSLSRLLHLAALVRFYERAHLLVSTLKNSLLATERAGRASAYMPSAPFTSHASTTKDRLLLDQRGVNAHEVKLLEEPSARLPAGCHFTDLQLCPNECSRVSASDPSAFYDCLEVAPQRAARNPGWTASPLAEF